MNTVDALHARPQGAFRNDDGSVLWRTWASLRKEVKLITWPEGERREIPMNPEGDGYFVYQASDIPDGFRYAYRLNDVDIDLPDPASRSQPEGVHKPSAVFTPGTYDWRDSAWKGIPAKDLVIYELHVGTFNRDATFAGIIPRLPELVELGVTAIELLPISQFPGARNWGYDGVHPFAAQNTYGGPRALQELVDAAHQAGLAVFLDCVYNHLGPEGSYFGFFGHYFTGRYHTPWGKALNYDDAYSDHVRKFVVDNARYWIREFHLDGLRLDAVQTIFDTSAEHLLAEIQTGVQEEAQAAGRIVHVVGETNQNDTRLTNPRELGGYNLSGIWMDDFHHAVHALLTGEREAYYSDYGQLKHLIKSYNEVFTYGGNYSEFFKRRHGCPAGETPREKFTVFIQNHDQVGNRARGERLSALVPPAASRLAAALLLLNPCTPLIFMGEEYGEDRPFPFFCSFQDPGLTEAVRQGRKREFAELALKWGGKIPDPPATATFNLARLKWDWQDDPFKSGLRALYQHLLHARRQWPSLREEFTLATAGDAGAPTLILQRGQAAPLFAWANLTPNPLPVTLPPPAHFLLSTEDSRWGGPRSTEQPWQPGTPLLPWELLIFGTPSPTGEMS